MKQGASSGDAQRLFTKIYRFNLEINFRTRVSLFSSILCSAGGLSTGWRKKEERNKGGFDFDSESPWRNTERKGFLVPLEFQCHTEVWNGVVNGIIDIPDVTRI